MPVSIKVNGTVNSLVHKFSNGISVATIPDVCKTPSPGGPVPIPYPNIAQSITLSDGTTTVKGDKAMAAIKGSKFALSNGDNPGVAGGVKSSTFMKEATWILYSFDTKMNGKNCARLMDKMFHNHENAANLAGVMQQIAQDLGLSEQDARAICEAFCQAQKEHLDPKNTAVKGRGSATARFGELLGKRVKGTALEETYFFPRSLKQAPQLLTGDTFRALLKTLGEPAAGLLEAAAGLPGGATVPKMEGGLALARVLKKIKPFKGTVGFPDLTIGKIPDMKAFDCKFTAFKGKLDTLSPHQKAYYPRLDSDGKVKTIDEDVCRCPGGKKQGWRASGR
ncbi:DUF4150 domain-containing protein [Roseateles sp.]|uniref:DUF4150 domain-containing protein n=1 Tax=Roseateles sp. TaxID=1971397 RepID=UPI002F3E5AFA